MGAGKAAKSYHVAAAAEKLHAEILLAVEERRRQRIEIAALRAELESVRKQLATALAALARRRKSSAP